MQERAHRDAGVVSTNGIVGFVHHGVQRRFRGHAVHGQAAHVGLGSIAQAQSRMPLRIEMRVAPLFKIVILTADPEYRYARDAGSGGHAFCRLQRGYGFVYGIERAAEKAGLLAGDHDRLVA